MFENPFIHDVDFYKRDINVFKHYVDQVSTYLSIMSGDDIDTCRKFVSKELKPGGVFEFKDKEMVFLKRNEFGDRELIHSTVRQFLKEVVSEEEILAPTWTTYMPHKKKRSFIGVEIDNNIRLRAVAKKAMFAAKAAKNDFMYEFYKSEQTNRKLGNNAVSGAHVTPSTPIYNKTAHSVLTSICRSTSGFGNSNNERLLTGNRHYRNWLITKNNIVSILSRVNLSDIDNAIAKYGLVYPSEKDTIECIKYSTDLYWWIPKRMKEIEEIIYRLTPTQRAAIVYTGDLYHIRKHNDVFMREFIRSLIEKKEGECENYNDYIKKCPDAYLELAAQICTDEVKGKGKDYSSLELSGKITTLALTIKNIDKVIIDYSDFIKTFIRTDCLPPSVAYLPESLRRAALTSDTDSTLFTVQDWLFWYCGGIDFSQDGIGVVAAMTFLASSSITHVLATMSANIGVEKPKLFDIAMKSEFRFDVFVPTQLGKHYYAFIGCQEGNVFDEHEEEIKGVHLKNSNIAKILNDRSHAMMIEIMNTVLRGEKISLLKYLEEIANIERMVMSGVERGDNDFLRLSSIKDHESYTKDKDESPYQHHVFWNTVFGQKYGYMPEPPYSTLKISLTVSNRVKLIKWLDSIKDDSIKSKLEKWFNDKEKTYFNTLFIPEDILEQKGFPEELVPALNYRHTAQELCKAFYIILETLGFYTMGDKVQRLVSDYY